ncbi:MAG TPA: hypothetical protein V6C90_25480 [Coleofasciculaceae cyanobacterium]
MDLEVAHSRCKDRLVWTIEQLQGKVEPTQLENITELIIQTMTGPWRHFHTPDHIFEVGGSFEISGTADAVEVLAALFHDLVYVQVDQGVSINIGSYIAPFIKEVKGKEVKGQLVIREATDMPSSPMFDLVAAIFGFTPGQALSPMAGQNEFLSALIAAQSLEPVLSTSTIAQVVACIEATVPFRPLSPSGLSPSEMLYQRLSVANNQSNFGWSEPQIIEIVKRCVRLANRDVENFAYSDSADFLDNTWNLLPETNHELINANSYTVAGYRRSLKNMEGFMNFLSPEQVFQRFKGEPDEETYQELISKTRKNLEVAKLYLGCKLVSIAIIEALSKRLGGPDRDIPLSTMMGELPTPGIKTPSLEQFLPDIPSTKPPETVLEREVLELLTKGRNQDSSYDLKNSPIATFIVNSMGFPSVRHLIERAKEFFAGTISADEFLSECDHEAIGIVIDAVEQLFESRTSALRGLSGDAKLTFEPYQATMSPREQELVSEGS